MAVPSRFTVIVIPLNRPPVVDFLLPPRPQPRGATVHVVGQRPTESAELVWMQRLQETAQSALHDLLAIDDPHGYLYATTTSRLVPVQFLSEDGFLTRNMGGWAAQYFGVVGLPAEWSDDPLLEQAETLADFGTAIKFFGADPALTAQRLPDRKGYAAQDFRAGFLRLYDLRATWQGSRTDYIERLYAEIAYNTLFADDRLGSIPDTVLLDELMGQLVHQEQRRRDASAAGDSATAEQIAAWQDKQRAATGMVLILKGEYIVGRHRRSTVLIAPELGVVVKQPAPEPFHEIQLAAVTYKGEPENRPFLVRDGALVTPRGRLRLIVEEGVVPRLHDVFRHEMYVSTLLGLTIEQFVAGSTMQEWVLADPARMTADLYDVFVLHQQGCELLGVENGDWHAANFVRRVSDGEFVHIDWGAARPLRADELTPESRLARLNQVQNIAYSFHNEALAARVLHLHQALLADETRLAAVRQRAEQLLDSH